MTTRTRTGSLAVVITSIAVSVAGAQRAPEPTTAGKGASHAVATATLARVVTVDDRNQSFNVEMLEVTGGKCWKPYGPELHPVLKEGKSAASSGGSMSMTLLPTWLCNCPYRQFAER